MRDPHLEIERKFLVRAMPEDLAKCRHYRIDQGYLTIGRDHSHVRVRRKGRSYTLTFKRGAATSREEREIRLTKKQFEVLWPGTAGARLTKTRHEVPWEQCTVEIDVYHGSKEGLIVAEVEFPNQRACESFRPPAWLGAEVTGQPRYSNTRLAGD